MLKKFELSFTTAQGMTMPDLDMEPWKTFKENYNQWLSQPKENLLIPRIIHQIWLGSSLPEKYATLIESWKTKNKGWEYRLWTEKEIGAFGLKNQNAFSKSPSFGVKSDIARYEILNRFGGIYVDTDFECLKPMEVLLKGTSFAVGLVPNGSLEICNAFIASVPKHPLLEAIIEDLSEPIKTHNGIQIINSSGPIFLTKKIIEYQTHKSDFTVLPPNILYPLPYENREELKNQPPGKWIKEDSFAIHFWESSWMRTTFFERVQRKIKGIRDRLKVWIKKK